MKSYIQLAHAISIQYRFIKMQLMEFDITKRVPNILINYELIWQLYLANVNHMMWIAESTSGKRFLMIFLIIWPQAYALLWKIYNLGFKWYEQMKAKQRMQIINIDLCGSVFYTYIHRHRAISEKMMITMVFLKLT